MYKEDEKDVLMCYFCGNEHHISIDSLPSNKILSKLIEDTSMDIDTFKFRTYQRSKKLCMLLKHKVDHLNRIQKNPSDYLDIFFTQLNKQVDLARDNCIHLIDKMHENMIKDINLFRFECLCQCKVDFNPDFTDADMITLKINEWHNILTGIDGNFGEALSQNRVEHIETDALILLKKVENSIQSLKEKLFLNVSCTFEPKEINLDSNIFGKLLIVSIMFFSFNTSLDKNVSTFYILRSIHQH